MNLENYGVQEMDIPELLNIDGGRKLMDYVGALLYLSYSNACAFSDGFNAGANAAVDAYR